MCPELVEPTNGDITFSGATSGFVFMTATYSCDLGYGLSGGNTTVRTCTSNMGPGEWTGTAPLCEGEDLCY